MRSMRFRPVRGPVVALSLAAGALGSCTLDELELPEPSGVVGCGDGTLDRARGETCDDRNAEDGDGCSPVCSIEPGFSCTGEPSTCAPSRCGDGVLDPDEACDHGN